MTRPTYISVHCYNANCKASWVVDDQFVARNVEGEAEETERFTLIADCKTQRRIVHCCSAKCMLLILQRDIMPVEKAS